MAPQANTSAFGKPVWSAEPYRHRYNDLPLVTHCAKSRIVYGAITQQFACSSTVTVQLSQAGSNEIVSVAAGINHTTRYRALYNK